MNTPIVSQRPERQQYREFFRQLPPERQERQLQSLLAWIASLQRQAPTVNGAVAQLSDNGGEA